jgi:hypothetical protein
MRHRSRTRRRRNGSRNINTIRHHNLLRCINKLRLRPRQLRCNGNLPRHRKAMLDRQTKAHTAGQGKAFKHKNTQGHEV